MKNPPLDSTDLTWLARLARALLGEAHAADDLVQETAVAALQAQPLREGSRRAWLGSVARRLAARHFRGEARRSRRERQSADSEALPDSTELVERAEVAEKVTAAARRLPEPFRRTILLRFLEGLSTEEIARKDGKPVDTVRWRVRRGLELLRQDLMRRHDGDWSSWSALLVPLAHSGGDVGASAIGASGTLVGLVASLIAMKATALLAATVLGGAGLLVWISMTPDPVAAPTAPHGASAPAPPGSESAIVSTSREAVQERRSIASPGVPIPDADSTGPARDLIGRVIDENGDPVAGATAYLVPVIDAGRPSRGRAGIVAAKTESDSRGGFRIRPPEGATTLDLGVVANGFLRQMVEGAWPERSGEELVVALERGRRLAGIVIDEYDRPVPGLELVCHTSRAGIRHVSPSQMALRSERAVLGDAKSSYQQCRGRTDGNGGIEFCGLPPGNLTVRCLDPGWTIENSDVAPEAGGFMTWVAKRRLGVRLTVVEARTGRLVDRASATFRYELSFADGEVGDFGQWVGHGHGGATFVLTPEVLPQLDDKVITRAVFYGTATASETKTQWRAEPIADSRGVSGVVEVRVEIDTFAAPTADQPPPTAALELDVRYADGSPFDRELIVSWRSRPDLGSAREGRDLAKRLAPGRYAMELVAGDVSLSVSDRTASGSLASWADTMRCEANRTSVAFVTLPRGAAVTIPKPVGWRGEWYLHASWRLSAADEWRGSWNYSTKKDTIVLTALRPAEWRFALRQESERGPDPIVRTVVLAEGVDLVVDK